MATRRALLASTASAAVVALAVALGATSDVPAAGEVEVPRACWWSDYTHAKLSNRCLFDRRAGGLWLMAVDGELVDARTQRLPVANLCHYFHGTDCP